MVDSTRTDLSEKRKSLPTRHAASMTSPGWAAARPTPIPGVEPDEAVIIMATLEAEGGTSTIGDLACAIAASPRPVSAILALADAGLLELDLAAPFDAAMRVRRAG